MPDLAWRDGKRFWWCREQAKPGWGLPKSCHLPRTALAAQHSCWVLVKAEWIICHKQYTGQAQPLSCHRAPGILWMELHYSGFLCSVSPRRAQLPMIRGLLSCAQKWQSGISPSPDWMNKCNLLLKTDTHKYLKIDFHEELVVWHIQWGEKKNKRGFSKHDRDSLAHQ